MITALHSTSSVQNLDDWAETYGITHFVGGDYDREVLDLYTDRPGRPQYAVINRNFDVLAIGLNRNDAFELILDEL